MLMAENIHKRYKHTVLNGVHFNAGAGEIIGIAGANGSGKSTLLSVLTAIVKPNKGTVIAEGENLLKNPRALRRYIGYVPQDYALFDNLTALDNIKLWASAYGADWHNALPFLFPESEFKTDVAEQRFLRQKAGRLSGGMKRRLSIALSLMHDPLYLIMDEPSAGLDLGFQWALREMLQLRRARGKSIIFTSHHADELLCCDRLYVLRNGAFVYEGAPQRWDDFSSTLHQMMYGVLSTPVKADV